MFLTRKVSKTTEPMTFMVTSIKVCEKGKIKNVIQVTINPLSPNSVQQQFSPNDIHTLSWD